MSDTPNCKPNKWKPRRRTPGLRPIDRKSEGDRREALKSSKPTRDHDGPRTRQRRNSIQSPWRHSILVVELVGHVFDLTLTDQSPRPSAPSAGRSAIRSPALGKADGEGYWSAKSSESHSRPATCSCSRAAGSANRSSQSAVHTAGPRWR